MGEQRDVDELLELLSRWSNRREDIVALALVGSRARGDPRGDSDVDLVLLTIRPDLYLESDDWVEEIAPGASPIRTEDWGAITERRLLLPSGLELDVGVGQPSWAGVDPPDPGSQRVVGNGMRPLYDPSGILEPLKDSLRP